MKLRNKKTGEIMDLECITIFDRPDKYDTGDAIDEFYTLAELNEEWEDYKPAEPLIKDEKVRKAVRAWAEAEGIEDCRYVVPDTFCSIDDTARIEFGVFGFDEGEYTIAELCGEEE